MKDWDEVKAWRIRRRRELIEARQAVDQSERVRWNDRITRHLVGAITPPPGACVAFCWPFKAEPDCRFVIRQWREKGAVAALPEVLGKGQPLAFREWRPEVRMTRGVYDIPVPADTPVVVPDIALVPMNGCDAQGYRLGYGGGYFDRTLAALGRRVLAIGVTFEHLRIETIYPQPHDIPMDLVVTEGAIYGREGDRLTPVDADGAAELAGQILTRRTVGRPHS